MKENLLYPEYCNPFDGKQENFWMKIEHYGRYLYFIDEIKQENKKITVGDFGCANGYGAFEISKYADKVYGFDKNYIDEARKTNNNSNIEYISADFDNLKIDKDISFDYITCFETLEHLEKPYEFLKQLYALLKNNGKLFLSIPNDKFEPINEMGKSKDIYHKQIFNINILLKEIKKIGFQVENVLGQAITNNILNREYHLIKDGIIDYNESIKKYSYDENTIKYFANIIGYPNILCIEETYSYFIIITKE
jgi:2-polyprenyl-3-methyl-5-hydroxy-6-metoxy-1,4-benzoquinol methylase